MIPKNAAPIKQKIFPRVSWAKGMLKIPVGYRAKAIAPKIAVRNNRIFRLLFLGGITGRGRTSGAGLSRRLRAAT